MLSGKIWSVTTEYNIQDHIELPLNTGRLGLATSKRVEWAQICEIPVNEVQEVVEYDSFGSSNQTTLLVSDIGECGEKVPPGYFL